MQPSTESIGAKSKVPQLPFIGAKVFYGWVIVFVGFVNQFCQGVVNQGFSAYADVLSTDFGWSKAVLAGPRSITAVENSLLGPLTGFLVDRFGPRVVVGAGMAITGTGLLVLGTTNTLWMYYAANILTALGLSLGGMLVMSVAVNNWFRRRGTLAQSVMLLGFSLAGVIGVPAIVLLQTALGWHHAATVTGIVIIALALPCSLLLRARPEAVGLLPDGDKSGAPVQTAKRGGVGIEYHFSVREALRTRAFWLLGLGWSVVQLGTGVVQVHLFLHLGEGAGGVGLQRTAIATVWSIAALCNIPARLLGGFVGDRVPKNITLGISGLLLGISVFALGLATSPATALLFAIPYGIGWGMSTPVMNAIQGDYFGRKSLGVIRGWMQLMALPFTIIAPVLVGLLADRAGNYRWALVSMSTVMVLGATLVFMAIRPKTPEAAAVKPTGH